VASQPSWPATTPTGRPPARRPARERQGRVRDVPAGDNGNGLPGRAPPVVHGRARRDRVSGTPSCRTRRVVLVDRGRRARLSPHKRGRHATRFPKRAAFPHEEYGCSASSMSGRAALDNPHCVNMGIAADCRSRARCLRSDSVMSPSRMLVPGAAGYGAPRPNGSERKKASSDAVGAGEARSFRGSRVTGLGFGAGAPRADSYRSALGHAASVPSGDGPTRLTLRAAAASSTRLGNPNARRWRRRRRRRHGLRRADRCLGDRCHLHQTIELRARAQTTAWAIRA
jgi:hypothetical protein